MIKANSTGQTNTSEPAVSSLVISHNYISLCSQQHALIHATIESCGLISCSSGPRLAWTDPLTDAAIGGTTKSRERARPSATAGRTRLGPVQPTKPKPEPQTKPRPAIVTPKLPSLWRWCVPGDGANQSPRKPASSFIAGHRSQKRR
jgi:hypothetical protein